MPARRSISAELAEALSAEVALVTHYGFGASTATREGTDRIPAIRRGREGDQGEGADAHNEVGA